MFFSETIYLLICKAEYILQETHYSFSTIPIGYFMGGFLVDKVFEPFMASQSAASIFVTLFGEGKGAGAAFLFLWLGFIGLVTCLIFRKDPHIWQLEK